MENEKWKGKEKGITYFLFLLNLWEKNNKKENVIKFWMLLQLKWLLHQTDHHSTCCNDIPALTKQLAPLETFILFGTFLDDLIYHNWKFQSLASAL